MLLNVIFDFEILSYPAYWFFQIGFGESAVSSSVPAQFADHLGEYSRVINYYFLSQQQLVRSEVLQH